MVSSVHSVAKDLLKALAFFLVMVISIIATIYIQRRSYLTIEQEMAKFYTHERNSAIEKMIARLEAQSSRIQVLESEKKSLQDALLDLKKRHEHVDKGY